MNIYPDGGIARLRVYGQPKTDCSRVERGTLLDLAAIENGAYLVAANNQHFGPASQMLMPGRGVNMGDGWETRRRREPGNDWAIVALAHPGVIRAIEVDTAHFKGNYPGPLLAAGGARRGRHGRIARHAGDVLAGAAAANKSCRWTTCIASRRKSRRSGPSRTYVSTSIPDGGVSRLRVFGDIE